MFTDIFSDDFKKKVKKAANSFKDTVQSTADVVSENAQKTAKTVQGKVQDAVDKGQLPDISKTGIKLPDQLADPFGINKKTQAPDALDVMKQGKIAVPACIKIFYYLVAADGQVQDAELEKLDEIGKNLDGHYSEYKDNLLKECEQNLKADVLADNDFDIITEATDKAILGEISENDAIIPALVLIWDMLVVACTDGDFDPKERKLIRYVVRKYGIDPAVYLEMESSMTAALDIEKELAWVKTTNRPYLQIEEIVTELNERLNTIYESVRMLAML